MTPDKITTHETDAKALLTEQFRTQTVVPALVGVFGKRAQVLEDVIWSVIDGYDLENAVGVQLDALGAIVKEPRLGRLDTPYRAAIKVRIRVNRAQGKTSDLIDVALLLDASAKYLEGYPLGWEVTIYAAPDAGDYIRLLTQAKATTSYGTLTTYPDDDNLGLFEYLP